MLRLSHSFRLEPTLSFQHADRLYGQGRKDEALQVCSAVLARNPSHFDALHLSGVICLDRGDHEQALAWLSKAEQVNAAHGRLQYHLGNAEMAAGHLEQAIACFAKAKSLQPGLLDALNNLGSCFRTLGRDQEAMICFQDALSRDPKFLPAHYNLGLTLARIGRPEEAVAHFTQVTGAPLQATGVERMAETHDALAAALMSLGRHEEALAIARTRTALKPGDPRGPWHESLLLLTTGHFQEGLPLYERRWELPGFRTGEDANQPPPAVPVLADLTGRRVHLSAEQGRGDTIQFVRYAAMVRQRARFVSLAVPADLTSLLRGAHGVDAVVADTDVAPDHDISVPLMSLPLVFETTMATVPGSVPYLSAPSDRVVAWGHRLSAVPGLRVGLCWWGAQHIPERSVPIRLLEPLFHRSSIQFHGLQKEIPQVDRDWLSQYRCIVDHSPALTDFAETAALVSCLDLVITIDTAVAHIAGALGRPVWVMLQRNADWRWFLGREDSPWYPTARLFRQDPQGDWEGVISRLAIALN